MESSIYYIVQNYNDAGRVSLERESSTYGDALALARETPRSCLSTYDAGWLVRDEHFDPCRPVPAVAA